jgi:hypothetical protein
MNDILLGNWSDGTADNFFARIFCNNAALENVQRNTGKGSIRASSIISALPSVLHFPLVVAQRVSNTTLNICQGVYDTF